ncbi:MAG TPA: SUMF1/EgtB/PvdO family nonheme iron enzyme, partial [Candidatus Cloacimonadota bacterium]|nr:SUMF1/EgtB/PvdO family nonheme iron enzyme [Candidatus Cloacimonadota bacterium]
WYNSNSGNKTQVVGTKQPNELGLYDVSGNVWEWCWDWYDSGFYGKSQSSDPIGAGSGSYRVLRGGGWDYVDYYYCRVAFRSSNYPVSRFSNCGFRVSRAIK